MDMLSRLMECRETERKTLERKVDLLLDKGAGEKNLIQLEYYLLEGEEREIEEMMGKTVYGVEIVKRTGNRDVEWQGYGSVLFCEDDMRAIINKLADNTVTPLTLPYVLEDLLG